MWVLHRVNFVIVDVQSQYVAVIIYRLTLHPLAKYPGPFFSKISDWSIVYHATTGNRHLQQLKEHETYGEVESE